MDFWRIIYIIDWSLFGIVALTVLYMAIFIFAGMFSSHPNIPKANHLPVSSHLENKFQYMNLGRT